jgi:hypothetical protein
MNAAKVAMRQAALSADEDFPKRPIARHPQSLFVTPAKAGAHDLAQETTLGRLLDMDASLRWHDE